MSGFGRALARGLAGGVAGFGVGLAKQAEDARKEALAERAERRADARVAEDRVFRSQEAALGRDFQAEIAESNQEFRASESAKDRQARVDAARIAASRRGGGGSKPKVTTLPDGRIGVFVDGKFQPYTEQDGTPIKGGNKDPKELADLTIEYLDVFKDDYDKTPEEKEAAAYALARKRLGLDGGSPAASPELPKLPAEPEKVHGKPVYLPKTAEDLANIQSGEQFRSPTDGKLYVKK
jgi:hypothetical protein